MISKALAHVAGGFLGVILFVCRKVSDQTRKRWDMGQGRLFPFTPSPTVFSLDICLAFKRLCFLLSRTINENPRAGTPGNAWWGVPPVSPNPDLISARKMSFSAPVFGPGLLNPYPFSGLKVITKRNINIEMKQKLCHHC